MKKTNHASLILASATLIAVGLACKQPAPLKPEPPKVDAAAETDAKAKAEAEAKAAADAKRRAEEEARKAEQERVEAARKAEAAKLSAYKQAAEKALQDIHFDYDQASIKEGDKVLLQGIAGFLKAYPEARLQIEGHCDERGTIEYNLALGERRAAAARDFLKALGIPEARLGTISYGKERPLCTDATEACWHKNRRDHFALKG